MVENKDKADKNPYYNTKIFIPITPSSDPSAHSSSPSLTQTFGIQEPLHFLLSGFVQPASSQSNSDDLHAPVLVPDRNEGFLTTYL